MKKVVGKVGFGFQCMIEGVVEVEEGAVVGGLVFVLVDDVRFCVDIFGDGDGMFLGIVG